MAHPSVLSPAAIESFIRQGLWEPLNSLDIWEQNVEKYPDDEAVVDSRSRLTWVEVKQLSDRIAISLLKLGLGNDQIMVIQLPNCVELPLMRLACEKAGIIPLLAGRQLRSVEMQSIIRQAEAVGIVIPLQFRGFDYAAMIDDIRAEVPSLKHIFVVGEDVVKGTTPIKALLKTPLEQNYPQDYYTQTRIQATDVCAIVHTSGTTGTPKLLERINARTSAAREAAHRYQLTRGDVFGAFTPAVTGTSEIHSYFTMPFLGIKSVMMDHFDTDETLRLVENERVTIATVVPAQLVAILNHPNLSKYDLSSWRCAISSASPLQYSVASQFEDRTGCRIVNAYGTMEAPGISITNLDDPRDVRLLTVGKPYAGTQLRLVNNTGKEVQQGESGRLSVRGPFAFGGYYNAPELNKKVWTGDGWILLSDTGRFDKEGNLMLMGRTDDVIIRGGQNIFPAEIEAILIEHPRVKDAVVVGMPDPMMGQKCCAYVVPKFRELLAFDDILTFLKNKGIAPYKLPERFEIIQELPLIGGQKVDRRTLQADIVRRLEKEVGDLKTGEMH